MRVTVAVMGVTRVLVAVRVRGFGGIAGLDYRSVRVLTHPWNILRVRMAPRSRSAIILRSLTLPHLNSLTVMGFAANIEQASGSHAYAQRSSCARPVRGDK